MTLLLRVRVRLSVNVAPLVVAGLMTVRTAMLLVRL